MNLVPVKIERWYDRHERSHVVAMKDVHGNQVGAAIYCGTKAGADVAERDFRAEMWRLSVAEPDDLEFAEGHLRAIARCSGPTTSQAREAIEKVLTGAINGRERERALREVLKQTLPLLVKLGDFIGNDLNRCDVILAAKDAIAASEPKS